MNQESGWSVMSYDDVKALHNKIEELDKKLEIAKEAMQKHATAWHSNRNGCLAECKWICEALEKLK